MMCLTKMKYLTREYRFHDVSTRSYIDVLYAHQVGNKNEQKLVSLGIEDDLNHSSAFVYRRSKE